MGLGVKRSYLERRCVSTLWRIHTQWEASCPAVEHLFCILRSIQLLMLKTHQRMYKCQTRLLLRGSSENLLHRSPGKRAYQTHVSNMK